MQTNPKLHDEQAKQSPRTAETIAMVPRVLETVLVTPSDSDQLPARSLPFTFFDVKWLRPPPVQRLFFYRLDAHADLPAIFSALKASLSSALRDFYPLAGRVRLTPGTDKHNRYELFYQPGDGVTFTAAEHDLDVDDLASDDPVEVAKIASLVPQLPKGQAVLAVQATALLALARQSSRGIALGVTVHHSACDGKSSTHLLNAWAAACAGAELPPSPVLDRTLIADPTAIYDVYCRAPIGETEFISRVSYPDDHLLATFTLTPELLRTVKGAVAAEAARRGAPAPPRCSSLVAAYSFVWSCYCRAKEYFDGDETTYFLFSVDHRARLKPPVPDGYLGNCLGSAVAGARMDELAVAGAEGIFAAFAAIAAALEEAVGEGSQERLGGSLEQVRKVVKSGRLLSVAGSPRFRVYDTDFGFGRPVKVDIVSVARTGAISVTEARGDGGGIEVGISFPAGGMERFYMCFADGMARLRSA